MRRRPAAVALQAVALTALVGGTTAFVTLDKTVTVSVDGQQREVRSFASTVGDVLDREGIDLGPRDLVAPAPDTALRDGQRVSVRYARQVSVDVDGKTRTVWLTATNVDQALDALGLRADSAFVSVSRSRAIGRDGISLQVRTPKALVILADGKRRVVTTTAPTIGAALAEAGVAVGPKDKVSVTVQAPVLHGKSVLVTRVTERTVKKTVSIAFGTIRKNTSTLYEGQTRVQRSGRNGVEVRTVKVTRADGKLTARKILTRTVTTKPVSRIVLVGTKARPETRASRSATRIPSSGGLNWAALAQCESGGNPTIVSSNGLYYGLYQFSLSTWRAVGGSGLPSEASPAEQTRRAQILYDRAGAGQWPVCGRYL